MIEAPPTPPDLLRCWMKIERPFVLSRKAVKYMSLARSLETPLGGFRIK